MIEANINDMIIGVVTAVVVIFVVVLGMGMRSPTEDTLPTIQVENSDFLGGIFTADVISFSILIVMTGAGLAIISLLQKRGEL
jgi:hypothetical protein